MTNCTNATMKDLLPDLLHDRLTAAVSAEVRAHVDGCDDCRAELALLVQVHAVAVAPRVDVSRIAAALPRYRAVPAWRRSIQSPQFRMAAALVILAGGIAVGMNAARNRPPTTVPGTARVAVTPTPPQPTAVAGTSTSVERVSASAPAELAMGEALHDLTDSELRALLDELGSLEAVTPSETEVVVPAFVKGDA